jgi:hypothetical protein
MSRIRAFLFSSSARRKSSPEVDGAPETGGQLVSMPVSMALRGSQGLLGPLVPGIPHLADTLPDGVGDLLGVGTGRGNPHHAGDPLVDRQVTHMQQEQQDGDRLPGR